MPSLPRVFIGSSTLGLPVAEAVAAAIAPFAVPVLWNSQVFGPTGATFQSLLDQMPRVDAAVLILSPDDRVSQQRDGGLSAPQPAPHDNLVFETGLFTGALGRERTVFLMPRGAGLVIPSDLAGVAWVGYPADPGGGLGATIDELRKWLTGEGFRTHTQPLVAWPNPLAVGADLLYSSRGKARHSLLLLANTLANVKAAYEGDYAGWLEGDPNRRIGMLFLNPNSPHASGRDRAHLHLGTRAAGLEAYKRAQKSRPRPRCVALLYDGPFRYSARALDAAPHTRTACSEVHVTHSTHERGIRAGYSLSLPYHRGAEAFEYFAGDALGVWRSAWANPPGHGVTLAACCPPEPDGEDRMLESLGRTATRLLEQTGRPVGQMHQHQPGSATFHLNRPSQWHFTLCSLKRTGRPWAGPFSMTAPEGSDEHLPPNFGEYVRRSCEELQAALKACSVSEIAPNLTPLKLMPTGHLIADAPEAEAALAKAMAVFLAGREKLANEFGLDASCLPKHLTFWPHVSVGTAFQNDAALPEPLTGCEGELALEPTPLAWQSSHFHAVHYAYRTFNRTVGTVALPLRGPVSDHERLVRGLGIG